MGYASHAPDTQPLDRDFPFAVDIPIPSHGHGALFDLIVDAAGACPEGALVWSHSTPADMETAGERRCWWSRIGTKTSSDAKRLARTFRSLGARRIR